MEGLIQKVIEKHSTLYAKASTEIVIKIDHEGKRILNRETQQLYKGELSRAELVNIVIRSAAVIDMMAQLKKCDWSQHELIERLIDSLEFYSQRHDTDLWTLISETREGIPEIPESLDATTIPRFRAIDGHYVRSKAELLIDNLLFSNRIVHAYEKKIPNSNFQCDFYIPPSKVSHNPVYIEFWGLVGDRNYEQRMKSKLRVYEEQRLALIQLFEKDMSNLQDLLSEKLSSFNITLTE